MADRSFPLGDYRPKAAWHWRSGMRRFGANRRGGRAHAGSDIYAPAGTPVFAVAPGKVVDVSPFYAGTWAVTVDHRLFTARYGEVDKRTHVSAGDCVMPGDKIGAVGILQGVSVPSDMLHFEIYAKGQSGKLTRSGWTTLRHPDGRPFYRRRDLVSSGPFLDAWAASAERPDPFPTLWRGHRGDCVGRLQGALRDRGAYGGRVDADFGPGTEAAVESYQRSRGLRPDGVAGPVTCLPLGLTEL